MQIDGIKTSVDMLKVPDSCVYIEKDTYVKEPYTYAKEPYAYAKEPCMCWTEPCKMQKRPNLPGCNKDSSRNAHGADSCAYIEQDIFVKETCKRTLHLYKRALRIRKRGLDICKRALHTCKRDIPCRHKDGGRNAQSADSCVQPWAEAPTNGASTAQTALLPVRAHPAWRNYVCMWVCECVRVCVCVCACVCVCERERERERVCVCVYAEEPINGNLTAQTAPLLIRAHPAWHKNLCVYACVRAHVCVCIHAYAAAPKNGASMESRFTTWGCIWDIHIQ